MLLANLGGRGEGDRGQGLLLASSKGEPAIGAEWEGILFDGKSKLKWGAPNYPCKH